jgi:hypothetical protein
MGGKGRNLYELMQEDAATNEPYRRYLERLQKLTAQQWPSEAS